MKRRLKTLMMKMYAQHKVFTRGAVALRDFSYTVTTENFQWRPFFMVNKRLFIKTHFSEIFRSKSRTVQKLSKDVSLWAQKPRFIN